MDNYLLTGVDIGGTFTDAVAVSASYLRVAKVSSNPADPGQVVMAAIEALEISISPDRLMHRSNSFKLMVVRRPEGANLVAKVMSLPYPAHQIGLAS
jgi:hypothetical protein